MGARQRWKIVQSTVRMRGSAVHRRGLQLECGSVLVEVQGVLPPPLFATFVGGCMQGGMFLSFVCYSLRPTPDGAGFVIVKMNRMFPWAEGEPDRFVTFVQLVRR